jgi:proteic killer suppression protein
MVIASFKNKKLKKFFENGDRSGIQPSLVSKIELILDRLDASTHLKDMNFPGSDFHHLKGELKDYYSVHVNGNWCIIYRFIEGEALNVDLVDYH